MKINNPPIKVTSEVISFLFECTKRKKECSIKEINEYINKTPSYVARGVVFLEENGVIVQKNQKYSISKSYLKNLDGGISKSHKLIKNVFVENKIFVEYVYFISQNKIKAECAKLLKIIYYIEHNEKTIVKIFDGWINFLELNIEIDLVKNGTYENLRESLNNKMIAGKFLKEEFGDHYNQVSKNVLKDLTESILNVKEDPEESINDVGRALEDFLRIDLNSGLNLSKCQGIAQIAQLFNQHNTFPTKLNNIVAGLSSVRSMGKAHGIDKKENLRWTITETTSLSTIILTISLMKSYLVSINDERLVF